MIRLTGLLPGLLAAGVLCAAPQIKSLSLAEMTSLADGAVYGEIVAARAFRHDGFGGPHYFTRLTLEGRALADERPITLDVVVRGGFVSPSEGVFNSEAPAADDMAIGRRVVAFYRWSADLGGGLAANTLVAAHGGLYRAVEGPRGSAVLGRGAGYAVSANVRLEHLAAAVRRLRR